ncbi:MAG: hypothetical protein JJU29_20105 [Verrucomicrobia bacterium]|nr:hypothetical protein [Verrucomicrobiota bacterium]MCH8513538.1 hypothetical protein [Kiritimatiellia bacterium]
MRDWWVTHTYPGMLGRPIEVTGEPHGQTPNQGEGEGEKERSNDGESAFVEINGADETQSGVRSTEVSLQQTAHGLDSMPALLSFRGERISGNQVVVTVFWEIRAEDLKLYPDLTGFQLYAAKPGEPETQEVGGVLLRAHLESEDGTLLFRFPHEAGDDAMVYALAPRGRYGEIGPLIRERLFVPARGADLEAPSQVRAEIRNLEVVSRYVSKRYYDEEQTQLWQVLPYARMNRGRDLIDGLNINYHLNGNVSRMTRMKLGKLHGIMVLFDEDGNVTRFYFGLEGERVTPEEYLEAIGLDAMHDEERKYLKKMPE